MFSTKSSPKNSSQVLRMMQGLDELLAMGRAAGRPEESPIRWDLTARLQRDTQSSNAFSSTLLGDISSSVEDDKPEAAKKLRSPKTNIGRLVASVYPFPPNPTASTTDIGLLSSIVSKPDAQDYAVKRKLQGTEAELQRAKATITSLESIVENQDPPSKRRCVEIQRDLDACKQQHLWEQKHVEDLRHQLSLMLEREDEAKALLAESEAKLNAQLVESEQKLKAALTKSHEFEEEIAKLQADKLYAVKEFNEEICKLQSELISGKNETLLAKDQVHLLTRQLEDKAEDLAKLSELSRAQQRVSELEEQLAMQKETLELSNSMKSELSKMPQLEAENLKLIAENAALRNITGNLLLLQEQVASLRAQLATKETELADAIRWKLQVEKLQTQLAQWESLACGNSTGQAARSPATISRRLSQLQANESLMTEKIGRLQLQLHVEQEAEKGREEVFLALKAQLKQAQRSMEDQAAQIKRLQRRLLLLSKEKDSFKRVIESYESEVTINISALSQERIQSLETLLSDYRFRLEQADAELLAQSKQRAERKEQVVSVGVQTEEPASTQPPCNSTEQSSEPSTQAPQVVENRVVHLQANPLCLAIQGRMQEIQQLRQENDQLKRRVQVLEELGPQAHDVTGLVEQQLQTQGSASDIEALKTQLSATETKNKRLVQAFRKTSQEFREVCYMLTGYRIDVSGQGKYKLSHMYADSPDEYLIFERTNRAELKMLETEYSSCLEDLISTYLRGHDSIPAFLSSLTLELFRHQTYLLPAVS